MKTLRFILIVVIILITACESQQFDYSADITEAAGTGGSLARFTISGNYMYTVDASNLKTFDISNEKKPNLIGALPIETKVETIFATDKLLFLGTRSGVYIYDISNPVSLLRVSVYEHVQSCDPVVVKGNYAYSTLNTSGPCSQGVNELDIIDISSPFNPNLINTLSMDDPKGLGISGSLLFVCDQGLKVFDLSNPAEPEFLKKIDSDAFDVIPIDTLLLVATEQGLSEYSIDADNEIHLASSLYTNQ
jgi:hypothetical protein